MDWCDYVPRENENGLVNYEAGYMTDGGTVNDVLNDLNAREKFYRWKEEYGEGAKAPLTFRGNFANITIKFGGSDDIALIPYEASKIKEAANENPDSPTDGILNYLLRSGIDCALSHFDTDCSSVKYGLNNVIIHLHIKLQVNQCQITDTQMSKNRHPLFTYLSHPLILVV